MPPIWSPFQRCAPTLLSNLVSSHFTRPCKLGFMLHCPQGSRYSCAYAYVMVYIIPTCLVALIAYEEKKLVSWFGANHLSAAFGKDFGTALGMADSPPSSIVLGCMISFRCCQLLVVPRQVRLYEAEQVRQTLSNRVSELRM